MVGRVAGKVAIITGAASGLGAESARRLAREGAALMLTDLATETGEVLASDLRAQGHRAQFLTQDVTDEAGWDQVVKATLDAFSRIDVLVNSAGVGGGGAPLAETTYENWRRITSINLDGTFLGMRAVVPAMTEGGGGSIINLSSILGKVGMAGATAYCASKGGVLMLTKASALELAPVHIRVNSVHPGFIETPMVTNALHEAENGN